MSERASPDINNEWDQTSKTGPDLLVGEGEGEREYKNQISNVKVVLT